VLPTALGLTAPAARLWRAAADLAQWTPQNTALLAKPIRETYRAACSSILPIFFQGYNQDAAWRENNAENPRPNRQKRSPMTETAIPPALKATEPTATPLALLLAQAAAPSELQAYRGALTPLMLDAAEKETAALLSGVAVHDLGWLRRVAVCGEDRFRWLSGMVTNTVNDLGVNAGAWNLVLNAQGRIQGDLHIGREGEALYLTIAADQYDRLLAHLDRFIIMDDVELMPLSETVLGLAGPLAAGLLARLGLPALSEPLTSARAAWNGQQIRVVRAYGVLAPHYELWVHAALIPALWQALVEADARPVGAASLEAFRIAEGIPAYGIDMAERDLPQEAVPQVATFPEAMKSMRANSEQLAPPQVALSFNKGCYLGQEIVERIRSRGSVHRHLRSLELFGAVPAAGAALTLEGGAVAGQITSAAELPLHTGSRVFALGMMRGEAEVGNPSFTYTTDAAIGTARILAAPPELEAE
jgi:folate-binding protein YgfZ